MDHAATAFDALLSLPVAPPPPAEPLCDSWSRRTRLDRSEVLDAADDQTAARDEMLAALAAEAKAASATTARLGPGRRLRVVAAGSQYQFAVADALDVSRGRPILLRLGHQELEGTLTGCGPTAVTLTLDEDVGARVPAGAELVVDAPWLIHRLAARVREVFELGARPGARCNLVGALAAVGVGEIHVAPNGPPCTYDNTIAPLEEEQERAVEIALRAPVSVIVAPPGTGKTVTLGAIAEAAFRAGMRVLVTAPSNAALDQLMLNVARRIEGEPAFSDALVVRIGDNASEELAAAYGDRVLLDDVIRRLRPDLHERLVEAHSRVDQLASQLTRTRDDASATARGSTARRTVAPLEAELTDARLALADCRRAVREYGRDVTSGARIVGATLTRAYLDRALQHFDVVLVDEASMALPPAIFAAASLARHHVVLAGDPYQLAAPARATGDDSRWLREDVFRRLNVLDVLERGDSVPYMTTLTVQRRGSEPICALLRTVWYGETLRTAPEVEARERARQNLIFNGASLCYIDTSALAPEARCPWGHTFENPKHAEVIADLVAYLDSAGELPPADGDCIGARRTEVLVMSHYRGQVAKLARQLRPWRDRGVAVRTVHRAQGSEATTAVFDLTLTARQHTRVSDVLTATRMTDDGSRLLCVACSRARSRLLLIGPLAAMERSINPRSILGRIYTHLLEHGHRVPLRDIVGTRAQLGSVLREPQPPTRQLGLIR